MIPRAGAGDAIVWRDERSSVLWRRREVVVENKEMSRQQRTQPAPRNSILAK